MILKIHTPRVKEMFHYDNKSKAEVTVFIYHLIMDLIRVFKFLEVSNSRPRSYYFLANYAFEREYKHISVLS